MRIVSLLPSATEFVACLGLADKLVGISHECDYPANIRSLPVVTKSRLPGDASSSEIDATVRQQLTEQIVLFDLDVELLQELRPDFLLTQTTCHVCAVAEDQVALACNAISHADSTRPEIINVAPDSVATLFQTLQDLGKSLDCAEVAEACRQLLSSRVNTVEKRARGIEQARRPKTLLLEWLDPPFSAGHWNPELIALAGGISVLGVAGERSKTLSWSQIQSADPDVIVVACCGFNTERSLEDLVALEKQATWNQLRAVRDKRVYVTDGSHYFNRPGPRLVDSLEILAHVLLPEVHPLPAELPGAIRVYSP